MASQETKDADTNNTKDVSESSEATPSLPSCECGNTRLDIETNPYVEAKGEWGAWGWFYLLIGITAIPKIVRFQCHQCHTVFDSSTDPVILKQNI